MLNFIKSLFRKSPAEPEPPRAEPPPQPPQAASAITSPPKAAVFKKLPMPEGPKLLISLASIQAGLPASAFAAKGTSGRNDTSTIPLPRAQVVSQLPTGKVRFTFAEVFSWAPEGSITWSEGLEATEVNVPLSEVLPKLSAADYPKRTGQSQTVVPEDIANLFGPKGVAPRPVAASFRSTPTAPTQQQTARPAAPLEAKPTPEESVVRPVEETPPQPSPAEPPVQQINGPSQAEPAVIKPLSALPSPESLRRVIPPCETASPAAQKVAPRPVGIEVPLEDLAKHYPGEPGMHLRAISTTDATVSLPIAIVEAGLKKGRLSIRLHELAGYVSPAIHPAQVNGLPDQEVELPMSVVVPLFMAAKRPQRDQKKTTVPTHIPDLFKSAVPSATTTQPPETPPSEPLLAAPATPPKPATPQSIVEALTATDGIEGALICLEDGMLVAAKLPGGIDPDFVAAFVPGVFQKGRELLKALNVAETSRLLLPQVGFDIHLHPAGRSLLLLLVRTGTNLPDSSFHHHIASLQKQTSGL